MRRLYIGGLSHSVTQKDLKDRFGKFGDVEDVEVRTRRDDEGVPYKTFGYININISDADLKKCLTVLNKSKWKGGTLQIETAKESFLHRLAEERQAAAEQRLQQPRAEDKRQKMLDSLSKAGVENFTMKAAVPGTEIPGHKDWVVSKFGRVLPVLQLRCQKGSKARTQKYDPSKYSHNIRKLDRSTVDESTPVTQLTWEVQGGDDDISKKRRGEFPPYEPPKRKKSQTDSSQNAVGRNRFKQTDDSAGHNETHQFTNGYEPPANHRLAQKRLLRFTDSDIDSDEEIRRMVVSQNSSHVALRQEEEEDILEVVGLDYLEKSGRARQQQKGGPDDEEENGYDSADTDELFASRKPPPPQQERLTVPTEAHLSGNDTDGKKKTKKKKKSKAGEEEDSSAEEHLLSRKPSSTQQRAESSQKQSKKMTVPTVEKPPVSQSDSDEDEEEDEDEDMLESADYSSDSDYEAMFSNATRLEISFADLKRLAEESQQTSETTSPSIPGTSSEQETNLTSGPAEPPAPKKGTMPDEILAAIMEEDSSEDEQKKKKKKRKAVVSTPLPAFQGTRALGEESETHECQRRQKDKREGRGFEVKKQKLEHPETEKKTSESEEDEEEEEEEEREEQEKKGVVKSMTRKAETVSSSSSDDDEDVEDEDEEESESADYSSVSDYEAMFSNITRLEISFADLQRLAEESQQTSETTAPSIPDTSSEQETDLTSGPAEPPAQKQKLDSEAPQLNHRATDSKTHGQKHTDTQKKTSESSEEEEEEEEEEEQAKKGVGKNITEKTETVSSSGSDDDEDEEEEEEEEDKMKANQTVLTVKASATASSSSSGSSTSSSEEEEEKVKQAPPRVLLGAKEEEERQREANLRRLAAVQQRQKEAEEHKKLIQGALANLDAPTAGAGKHIVFGSDDDDDGDAEDKKQITSDVTVPKKTLFQESQSEDEATGDEAAVGKSDTTKEKVRLKPSGPQLFSGSDDEEDADEEEDGSRFDIRPQFEGRSGQKLMELQSRFGTDERFRMDSRFLEEDEDDEEDSEKKKSVTEEEEALEEEKKKNLSILQSVLGSSQQTCSSKTTTKAKTFRDVSALHYDPSREEHTAFETKTDETKKESKAARRKKREEAQKLPEVSKEIFYDVSGDLKAVFGQTKEDDVAGEDEKKNWDQEEEEDEEEEGGKDEQPTPLSSLLSADPSVEKVESSGFKFSFFGDDTETGSGETAEYKIESIQAPKVSWQQNLHFQDSSSDEDEEEKEEEEEQSTVAATTTEEETSSKRDLFFFYPEDIRLKEGPRLFCRPSQLEEQREQWEERRNELKQEYRKKHKDARRKLKSSLKS